MSKRLPLNLLYVEDDSGLRTAVSLYLAMQYENVATAVDGVDALRMVEENLPDIVLTDIQMSNMDGIEFTTQLKSKYPTIPVIITTAFTEVEYLLKSIDLGVCGFVSKPLDYEQLAATIQRVATPLLQDLQIHRLQAKLGNTLSNELGWSLPMQAIGDEASYASEHGYCLTIEGESGVGKTRLAHIIHSLGRNPRSPCITIHCGGCSDEHLEVELFGRGKQVGKLVSIGPGTVILIEPNTMSLAMQNKVARAIQNKEILPVGGLEPLQIKSRVVATLLKSAQAEYAEGKLTESLFYQLTEQVIKLPPLRTIVEEIPRLAALFLKEAEEDLHRSGLSLSNDAVDILLAYPWPGNITQMKNIIRRAAIYGSKQINGEQIMQLLPKDVPMASSRSIMPPTLKFDELELWAIEEALQRSGGKKMYAAELLGIDYKRFKRKVSKYHGVVQDE